MQIEFNKQLVCHKLANLRASDHHAWCLKAATNKKQQHEKKPF